MSVNRFQNAGGPGRWQAQTPASAEALKRLLEKSGVKPSLQRISILKYMVEHENHPSVDIIYKELSPAMPTLSKTTVYNTLNMLSKKGIIALLSIDGAKSKYDYIQTPHAHFKCRACGHIYDVAVETDLYDMAKVDEHLISDVQINLTGTCHSCQQNQ